MLAKRLARQFVTKLEMLGILNKMPYKILKELIEGGAKNIPALSKLLKKHDMKLGKEFDLDKPFYHGTSGDHKLTQENQYFSDNPKLSSEFSFMSNPGSGMDGGSGTGVGRPNVHKVYTRNDNLMSVEQLEDAFGEQFWKNPSGKTMYGGGINTKYDDGEDIVNHIKEQYGFDGVEYPANQAGDQAATNRMMFDPDDAVNAYGMDSILKHPEGKKLREIAGATGALGLGSLSALRSNPAEAGTISAPEHPTVNKIADMIQAVGDSVKGSPAEYVVPGEGLATWLRQLSYKEKPSNSQRLDAMMDVM
jgi:hypothetical protein